MIDCIQVDAVGPLNGQLNLVGAKNAILVIMASTLLTSGKSVIGNVPVSSDVLYMIKLLESLGAHVVFDREHKRVEIDTSAVNNY